MPPIAMLAVTTILPKVLEAAKGLTPPPPPPPPPAQKRELAKNFNTGSIDG